METIETIAEYINVVHKTLAQWGNDISNTHAWFRGQSNKSWTLLPKLYRPNENPLREREMFRDFKLRANEFISIPLENDMELLFIMQHYGMPTRLLDWTESYLFALLFAVESEDISVDAAVWILNSAEFNGFFAHLNRVPMSSHDLFEEYLLNIDATDGTHRYISAMCPMAVRPRRSTARIVAQRGMLTIHGSEKKSIDDYVKTQETPFNLLEKIIISGKSKSRIKKELLLAGISYSTLFLDLDGLSKEISYRYSENYMKTKITGP